MHFRWLHSTYAKILIGGVVAFVGIASGVYVGFAFSGNGSKDQKFSPSSRNSSADFALKIVPGEAFPIESYHDNTGATHNFDVLLGGKNTILIFTLWGCGPCNDLLQDTREKMISHLIPGTQVVIVTDGNQPDIPPEYTHLVKGLTIISVDMAHWDTFYGLSIWPTIIGIDSSGIIRHIQITYAREIDHELAEYFFSK